MTTDTRNAGFTPGPWFYTGGDVWIEVEREGPRGEPELGQELVANCGSNNAPLIAAAPSLYVCAVDLIDHMLFNTAPSAGLLDKFREAIAKANPIVKETIDNA